MNGFQVIQNLNPDSVNLVPAGEEDLPLMVKISEQTFLDHSKRMSPHGGGGPVGFDSIHWHRNGLSKKSLYKICIHTRLIGGLYLSFRENGSGWVNRIFIHPDFQGRGIGRRVFNIMERQFSSVLTWGLDTPEWAVDNLHFYHSMGYRNKEIRFIQEEGFQLVILEKKMNAGTEGRII